MVCLIFAASWRADPPPLPDWPLWHMKAVQTARNGRSAGNGSLRVVLKASAVNTEHDSPYFFSPLPVSNIFTANTEQCSPLYFFLYPHIKGKLWEERAWGGNQVPPDLRLSPLDHLWDVHKAHVVAVCQNSISKSKAAFIISFHFLSGSMR